MSLKQQFEDSQEAQLRVYGTYFIGLSKSDPGDVEWVRCAYAYGQYHNNVCTESEMECEDCSNSKCTHIMTKCLECKKNICNSCSWTCRLNAKNAYLKGEMSEFTSCTGCKNTIPPKPVFNPMAQFQQYKAENQSMNRRSSDMNSIYHDNAISFRGGRVTTIKEELVVRPGKLATFHSHYNAFLEKNGILQKTKFSVSTSPDNDDEWEDNNESSNGSGSGEYESNLPSPEGDASSESDYTDNNDDGSDPDPDNIYNYRPSTPSAKKLIYDWDEGDDEPTEMWDII